MTPADGNDCRSQWSLGTYLGKLVEAIAFAFPDSLSLLGAIASDCSPLRISSDSVVITVFSLQRVRLVRKRPGRAYGIYQGIHIDSVFQNTQTRLFEPRWVWIQSVSIDRWRFPSSQRGRLVAGPFNCNVTADASRK